MDKRVRITALVSTGTFDVLLSALEAERLLSDNPESPDALELAWGALLDDLALGVTAASVRTHDHGLEVTP